MANALEQQINDLRNRLRTGPVGTFFTWWVEELRLALPESWQEKLQHATRRLAVVPGDDKLEFALVENRRLSPLGIVLVALVALESSTTAHLQHLNLELVRSQEQLRALVDVDPLTKLAIR